MGILGRQTQKSLIWHAMVVHEAQMPLFKVYKSKWKCGDNSGGYTFPLIFILQRVICTLDQPQ
jgi:hypothetical protein